MIYKFTDFGLSTNYDPDAIILTRCGSADFAAPEIFKQDTYNQKVDIWSM
jgi:serine/threonine protein kinase